MYKKNIRTWATDKVDKETKYDRCASNFLDAHLFEENQIEAIKSSEEIKLVDVDESQLTVLNQ